MERWMIGQGFSRGGHLGTTTLSGYADQQSCLNRIGKEETGRGVNTDVNVNVDIMREYITRLLHAALGGGL